MSQPPTSRLSSFLAAGSFVALLATVVHCGSGAVGVDACRQIESRRCELAQGCDGFAIENDSDVVECQLFYHDQCLFGIADIDADPDPVSVDACVAALEAAAACRDAENLGACAEAPTLAMGQSLEANTACKVIAVPERLAACDFLAQKPDGGDGGSGGTGDGGTSADGGAGGG